jgi:hypothetical protein
MIGIAYFDAIPENVTEDDLVLDVVFDDSQVDTLNGVVSAHVRRVLHGHYAAENVRVGLGNSSCTDSFQFGRAGVVVGRLVTPDEGQARVDARENRDPNERLRLLWPFRETVLDPRTETRVDRELRLAGLAPLSNASEAHGDYDGDGRGDSAHFFENSDGALVIGVRLTSRGEVLSIWGGDLSSLPYFTFRTVGAGTYRTQCEVYGPDCGGAPHEVVLVHDAIVVTALEGPAEYLHYWEDGRFKDVIISE